MHAMNEMNPHQQKIIQIALPLFYQKGYEGVSLNQVAQATGLSKATILHHFANKDALYLQTLLSACQQLAPKPIDPPCEFKQLEPFCSPLGKVLIKIRILQNLLPGSLILTIRPINNPLQMGYLDKYLVV